MRANQQHFTCESKTRQFTDKSKLNGILQERIN